MFKKGIIRKGGAIGFGGGEPTLLPELDKLLDLFLKNGFDEIRVPTSGIKYSGKIAQGISTGQLSVNISVDSSSRETYKRIKQVDAYDKVCKNLKKYAKAQKNDWNVISKYIIIPGINDNKKEIDGWLNFNTDNNIRVGVTDIENSRLKEYREKGADSRIIDLIKYVIEKAKELGYERMEICDRAKYLINEH